MRTLLLVPLLLSMTAASVHGQTADERLHTLRNLTYLVPPPAGLWLPLTDGEHRTETPTGLEYTDLRLGQVAFGDLDSDGRQDAAVILVFETVMKAFYSVVVVGDVGGEASYLAGKPLSDREGMNVVVDSLWIESDVVHVEMTRHTEEDPNCCPYLHLTSTYRLEEDRLLAELNKDPYEEVVVSSLKHLAYADDEGEWLIDPPADVELRVVYRGTDKSYWGHHACSSWAYQTSSHNAWARWDRVRFSRQADAQLTQKCSTESLQ